jgi:hypothetical protein
LKVRLFLLVLANRAMGHRTDPDSESVGRRQYPEWQRVSVVTRQLSGVTVSSPTCDYLRSRSLGHLPEVAIPTTSRRRLSSVCVAHSAVRTTRSKVDGAKDITTETVPSGFPKKEDGTIAW